ncbi:MAG: TatD family hydrolase [Bacteroidetes bacterium]|nr:TatD family hydrolase [Bacteroidota bacterium]
MVLVDTHAHIYGEQFDSDIEIVLQRAYHSGIEKIFLPAIDHETHDRLLKLCQSSTGRQTIYPMMGVHPCSINENYKQELATAVQYLDNGTKYYAVGEIGLDFYWDVTHKEQQFEAFEIQIGWAIERGLPIVIHSRKSTYDCIEVLKKYKGRIKGIFHCFSGSVEEAREIIKLDFMLGIGGVVTYKNAGLKEVLKEIGLDHVVLETDAPYLTPVPYRGKRNEPSYIRIIAEEVAAVTGLSLAQVADITTANALKVFQL